MWSGHSDILDTDQQASQEEARSLRLEMRGIIYKGLPKAQHPRTGNCCSSYEDKYNCVLVIAGLNSAHMVAWFTVWF